MSTPTQEQIDRLPQWARVHMRAQQQRIGALEHELKVIGDAQTPSPIYTEEMLSPTNTRHYFQCPTSWFVVEHPTANVRMEVILASKDDGQRPHGIEVTFSTKGRGRLTDMAVFLIPRSPQKIALVHKDDLR